MGSYRFRGIYGGRTPIEDYNLAVARSSARKLEDLHKLCREAVLPCTEPVGSDAERCGECAGCQLRAWADQESVDRSPMPVMGMACR